MNSIKIILASKVMCIEALIKHSKQHLKDFVFVIDNHFSKEYEDISELVKPYAKYIVYTNEIIDDIKNEIQFSKLADDIFDIYPPTIKIMLPIYFKNKGYDKLLYLDDDIILNDNLDGWLKYENAIYKETMSGIRKEWDSVSLVFGSDLDKQSFNKNCLINSGHFVLNLKTLNMDNYKHYFIKFLNNDKTYPQLLHSRISNHHGQFWVYEQRFLGFIFYKLVKCENKNLYILNKNVKLVISKSNTTNSFAKADVIHFALASKPKKLIYENLEDMLNNKIKNTSEFLKLEISGCINKKLASFIK